MPLTAGARVGSYEIHRLLGAGGMGEVYLADDQRLHRQVALKVLPADLADTPERRARFERETSTAASLSHPNVCSTSGWPNNRCRPPRSAARPPPSTS